MAKRRSSCLIDRRWISRRSGRTFSLSLPSLHLYLFHPFCRSHLFFIGKALSTPGSLPELSPMRIRSLFVMGVAFWSCSSGPPDSPSDKNGNQITGLDAQPSERPVSPSEWPLNLNLSICDHTHVKQIRLLKRWRWYFSRIIRFFIFWLLFAFLFFISYSIRDIMINRYCG